MNVFCNHSCTLGEGIFITKDSVYWLDIDEKRLFCKSFTSKNVPYEYDIYILPEIASTVLNVAKGEVYLATENGVAKLHLRSEKWTLLSINIDLSSTMRSNDGCMIGKSSFFYGTMEKCVTGDKGCLYFCSNGVIIKVASGFAIPNAFIEIFASVFLISDSLKKIIYKVEINTLTGKIIKKSKWLNLTDKLYTPDGGCMDKNGNIYIAMWNGSRVNVYDKDANLLNSLFINCPNPTNCALSKNNDFLYITTAKTGLTKNQLISYPNSGSVLQLKL